MLTAACVVSSISHILYGLLKKKGVGVGVGIGKDITNWPSVEDLRALSPRTAALMKLGGADNGGSYFYTKIKIIRPSIAKTNFPPQGTSPEAWNH